MKIETIADIVAEKRNRADEIERDVAEKMKRGEMISDQYAREVVADLRKEADRIEAAAKRECGNAAAMREALEAIVKVGYPHNFQREAPHIRGYCYEITDAINKCFAALAKPSRNCDVGTVEDQLVRFDRFCGAKVHCRECVLRNSCSCKFAWAQLPYVDRKKRGVTK